MPENNTAFAVKVNDFNFQFKLEDLKHVDIVKHSASVYNLIRDNRSVNVSLLDSDNTGKFLRVEVDGEVFDVEIKDDLDQMLDKMGFGKVSIKQIKEIKAPMPGLVLEINVTEGEEVAEGHKILILEAMKMENAILIHTPAKIKKVIVTAGQAVEKGQLLVELE
ncbi:MAG: biotin/lipoyl-containing protein [Chitinophagaceae bacterium]